MRYQFVKENRSSFPVVKMCQMLSVSQSGFYRWSNAPLSHRKKESQFLRQRVFEPYKENKGMAGSPMITVNLCPEPEFPKVSKNRVACHMRDMGMKCKTNKKYVVTTDSKHSNPIAANLLNREFIVSSPDTVRVGDTTYLRTGEKRHYLSVFIDLFSRVVVGWDLSESLDCHSMIYSFQKALWRRRPDHGLLVHSDRGVQYFSAEFRDLLRDNYCIQFMSRKGNCWDNAVPESILPGWEQAEDMWTE